MTREEAKTTLYEWLEPKNNKTVSSDDFSEAIEVLLDEINLVDNLIKLHEQERKIKLPELIDFWWAQEDESGKRLVETKEHFISAMKKAYSIGISHGQHSLLPDLYEAAFNYAESCKYEGVEKLLCVEHFKAGAEWMAEQGETQEHFVIGHTEASHGIPVIVTFPDPKTFEIGDNVIVQIRKKEE